MADYFYAGGGIGLGPPAPEPPVEPYPRPEVTSRDGVDGPAKTAVTALVKLAQTFGWSVTVTYARGHFPHAAYGTPGPLKESLAVRMARVGGWRAVAVYEGADKSWSWGTLAVQSFDYFPEAFATLDRFMDCAFGPVRQPIKAAGPMLGPARRPLRIWGPL